MPNPAAERRTAIAKAASERALLVVEATRPGTAHYRFGAFSSFLGWCQKEGYVAVSLYLPASKARRLSAVRSRSRYRAMSDLARLWHAADAVDGFAPAHRNRSDC
ncbi:hypothetical protein [Pseudoroseomonas ludipueritiae]|uniref:Resolvase/invertase-type recombinase catalytic domain-containing protein n=1 Tax=Pseudoroseomonas ludipueritiae TaxID=198093 RepID=A0ABR7R882_9PROT|nr:hypothetical protein [Pseudoroseomonas ludipueritiae]MBC9177882.1 hypothetical protein [Pseudoroseomonas ludipueritiae]